MDFDTLHSPAALRVLLLVVLFAPLGFAGILALTGDRFRVSRRLAGLFALLHLGVTLLLTVIASLYLSGLQPGHGTTGFHPVGVPGDVAAGDNVPGGGQLHRTNWNLFIVGKPDSVNTPAVQFFIGLDGLNVWLVALASLMTYVAVAVSWNSAKEKAGGYYAWLFVLQTAVTGAFVSFDVLLFYVFFELTLIPTFFLIGGWGVGGGKRDAARKFFLYTLFGSLFSLIGLIGIVYTNPVMPLGKADVLDPAVVPEVPRGSVTFDVNRLMLYVNWRHDLLNRRVESSSEKLIAAEQKLEAARKQNTPTATIAAYESEVEKARLVATNASGERDRHNVTQVWLFFALIAGFVVKVPLVPFHTWLPGAYSEAPMAVTLLMSALLAKLGTLGMLRIVVPLCPDAAVQYGLPVFGTLGAIGVVYAAFCAFSQKDVKLMAAYSSVSHLGLLVLGMFALNAEGLGGATLHMVNHGLSGGLTFALLAMVYDRYRTTDRTQLGGLWAKYPKWAFFLIVASLASVGLPGLNNFVTEMLLLGGLFKPWAASTVGYWLAVAGAAGILLSAWYTFTMLKNVLFGPPKEPATLPDGLPKGDLSGRELWAVLLPTTACVVLGVFPQPFLDVSKNDVSVVEAQAHHARQRINPTLANAENPPPREEKVEFRTQQAQRGGPAGGGPPGGGVGRPGGGGPAGGPPR